jgi:hypothetical protein
MNILNSVEYLQKGKFSFFKIKTAGDVTPTGFQIYNLPQGMLSFEPDGWVYGTPSEQGSSKTIIVAKSEFQDSYKFVDIIVKDIDELINFKNEVVTANSFEEVDISKIENFDADNYFQKLKTSNTTNLVPNNVVNFQYATGQNVNINLGFLLSGFYKITGGISNPTGFSFINNSYTSSAFYFQVIKKTGISKITGWGNNDSGRAIGGNKTTGAILVSAGNDHSLALLDGFILTGWGSNQHSKVYGTQNLSNIQNTPMRKLTGVAGISAGSGHSLALLFNKKVTGWGLNANGQVSGNLIGGSWSTNPVAVLTGVRQVNAGGLHSLALLSNRRVTGWGDNTYNQALGGLNITGVIQISAGQEHSLALLNNFKITGWGRNNLNQVSGSNSFATWEDCPPGKLSGVIKVEAGAFHSLALLSNGSVTGWGLNNFNQATSFCVSAGAL